MRKRNDSQMGAILWEQKRLARYTVTPQTQVIEAHNLIPGTSAQKAKLMALIQAL